MSFSHEGEEVVRAILIDPFNIQAPFADFDPRQYGIEIFRVETALPYRCHGHARKAVDIIREQWAEAQVVAWSLDDHVAKFWQKVGFEEKSGLDGQRGRRFFVAAPLTSLGAA